MADILTELAHLLSPKDQRTPVQRVPEISGGLATVQSVGPAGFVNVTFNGSTFPVNATQEFEPVIGGTCLVHFIGTQGWALGTGNPNPEPVTPPETGGTGAFPDVTGVGPPALPLPFGEWYEDVSGPPDSPTVPATSGLYTWVESTYAYGFSGGFMQVAGERNDIGVIPGLSDSNGNILLLGRNNQVPASAVGGGMFDVIMSDIGQTGFRTEEPSGGIIWHGADDAFGGTGYPEMIAGGFSLVFRTDGVLSLPGPVLLSTNGTAGGGTKIYGGVGDPNSYDFSGQSTPASGDWFLQADSPSAPAIWQFDGTVWTALSGGGGGGGGYASLTGAGETATPGGLVQLGPFTVTDVSTDGIFLQTAGEVQIIADAGDDGNPLELTSLGGSVEIGAGQSVTLSASDSVAMVMATLGFFGATPVAQAGHPSTLADVITILTNLGLCA